MAVSRRQAIEMGLAGVAGLVLASRPEWMGTAEAAGGLPYEQGKYQTFPRLISRVSA